MTFGIGRSKSRSARITTRPRAPWLTNWRASHLPVCATKRRTQPQSRGSAKKLGARHSHCPHERARDEHDLPTTACRSRTLYGPRMPPWTSLRYSLCSTSTPNRSLQGVDRPSWHPGAHPHRLTPITLPAASRVPLVAIGASVTQIPCRHEPSRAHSRCRIYVCRLKPRCQKNRSISCFAEGVHIRQVRPSLRQLSPASTV
jgi:hypothetical protein